MSVLLRITAGLSLLWAVALFFPQSMAIVDRAPTPITTALANGLAIAHVAFAYLFWRAARNPRGERTAIYTALLVLGLRAANGTYEVLYLIEGPAAVRSLIDMVSSIALFVGVLNTLPSTLRASLSDPPSAGSNAPPSSGRN